MTAIHKVILSAKTKFAWIAQIARLPRLPRLPSFSPFQIASAPLPLVNFPTECQEGAPSVTDNYPLLDKVAISIHTVEDVKQIYKCSRDVMQCMAWVLLDRVWLVGDAVELCRGVRCHWET